MFPVVASGAKRSNGLVWRRGRGRPIQLVVDAVGSLRFARHDGRRGTPANGIVSLFTARLEA
jgi:hypothetical protein